MKARLILLFSFCTAAAFGQYAYDYVKNPVVADSTRWNSNGSVSFSSIGATFSGSGGGSLISAVPISVESGGSVNDYEVTSTLALNSGGGTYIHFFRTSSGTVVSGSGSYISAELVVPSGFSGSGAATLYVKQCVGGSVSTLNSAVITATNGMTLRSVIFGAALWIYTTNNVLVMQTAVGSTAGNPGIGGYNIPSGSGFAGIQLGHHDTVAPAPVSGTSVASSVFPTSASLQWQGVLDDMNGVGVFLYYIYRNGVGISNSVEPEYTDSTVVASTTYTYTLYAEDYHGNMSAGTTVTVTTPPTGAIDPRRTGLYSTGSYWGGGGEQIDTLSGNLNYSIPLLTAQGRTGWTVPVSLVYDSQNWRQDSGVNWKLGNDVGFGFGWKMLIGSITPYYDSYWGGVDHYVYTDGTGAQYRLNQNNSGVWTSSTQSVYVWLDTTVSPNRLHFRDGKFWVMGSTSGGGEADAGTMYPTVIEDTFGNQVIVTYHTGFGLPYQQTPGLAPTLVTQNTSSRIVSVEDTRAAGCTYVSWLYLLNLIPCSLGTTGSTIQSMTFGFVYDHTDYASPHLTSYGNGIGTSGGGGFVYTTGAQEPPFGPDPRYSGATAIFLSQMTNSPVGPYQFGYDSAGAGELMSVIVPTGGELSWNYGSFAYIGSRSLREVSARYLKPDVPLTTSRLWTYGISRPDAPNSVTVHSAMTLTDASGVGAKTWQFTTSGSAWQLGLISQFIQSASSGGTVLQDDTYTWSQDPVGRPYISAKSTAIGQGTSNPQTAYSTQTLDQYGNATQSVIYPYGSTTAPLRTYANTYLSTSTYTSHYIFDLLTSTTLSVNGGTPFTIVSNQWDGNYAFVTAPDGTVVYGGYTGSSSPPAREYDSTAGSLGALTTSIANGTGTGTYYYPWGTVGIVNSDDGTTSTASADASTNYAAPVTITAQSYDTTVGYTPFLGVAQTTGSNGEQLSLNYDTYGRPTSGYSPYWTSGAATVTYCYPMAYSCPPLPSLPAWQQKTGPDGVTTTTVDGFGHTVLVARGDSSGVHSNTSTVYAPCACSPLGKIQQVSQPYVPTGGPTAWTAYTYDGMGRTLSVVQPDGASTTTYAYAGNQTTVTDPTGKWKQFTNDVLSNLTTVVEPDPANQPGGTLTTSYSYDWMNHVSCVDMDRGGTLTTAYTYTSNGVSCTTVYSSGTGTRQTRTFVYNSAAQLTSATNPENGTVTYTYSTTGSLHDKHDAKGQDAVFTYDSLNRVTMVQQYPNGVSYGEDLCARVTYSYDTNPVNPSFSQHSTGRLTVKQYGGCYGAAGYEPTFYEMYSYHPAGGVTAKQVLMSQWIDIYGTWTQVPGDLEVDYTYDQTGRVTSMGYPWWSMLGSSTPNVTFGYTYDTMGRPASLTDGSGNTLQQPGYPVDWVQTVQYDYAGRLASLQYQNGTPSSYVTKTVSYNMNGQLSSLSLSGSYGVPNGTIQYQYSTTQNNGQVTQVVDGFSGETIAYQYDLLKRVTQAASNPTSGSTPTAWTQQYTYDGFGNLTSKKLNGTTTSIPVNAATNQLSSAYYDANGNMTSGVGATLTYDESNRMSSATEYSGWSASYYYAPDNKRVYVGGGSGQFILYGVRGEQLGVFSVGGYQQVGSQYQLLFGGIQSKIWFAGKLIWDYTTTGTGPVYQDRLQTNRFYGARFRPYGDEITSTSNDREKFATYTRDSYTGLDYADQRYYASAYGRFNTPDRKGGKIVDPGSLNRYAYVSGDPVNSNDPSGLCAVMIAGIEMGPGSSAAWTQEALTLGADTAYPYANQGFLASLASVIRQGLIGPNAATSAAYNAITHAIANSSTPVDIVAYSGGAGAFTAAYDLLTPYQQSKIGTVLYISPGANGELAEGNGPTSVVQGTGGKDWLATIGTQIPFNVPIQDTNCAHQNLNCLFNAASGTLSAIQATGFCNSPYVYTQNNLQGTPGLGVPFPPPVAFNYVFDGDYWPGTDPAYWDWGVPDTQANF